jgi:hypothetical protein
VLQEQQAAKEWSNATFNRYCETGRAIFNWARKRKLVNENPFLAFDRKAETTKRDTRITAEQERRLLDACRLMEVSSPPRHSKLRAEDVAEIRRRVSDGERQIDVAKAARVSPATISQIIAGQTWCERPSTIGSEMRRRLIAALDLGLRAGEMLKIQRKHIIYGRADEVWAIQLSAETTKAGKNQVVFVGSDRLKAELEKHRFLKPDDYVFGDEGGRRIASV